MNYVRTTISMPGYLYGEAAEVAGKRGLSGFVTRAVEKLLLETKARAKRSVVDDFFSYRDKLPKFSNKEILRAMRKGLT